VTGKHVTVQAETGEAIPKQAEAKVTLQYSEVVPNK
jgi:hypothetical protein